jgi:hypothetical protein
MELRKTCKNTPRNDLKFWDEFFYGKKVGAFGAKIISRNKRIRFRDILVKWRGYICKNLTKMFQISTSFREAAGVLWQEGIPPEDAPRNLPAMRHTPADQGHTRIPGVPVYGGPDHVG